MKFNPGFFFLISLISRQPHQSPKYIANKCIVHLIFGIDEIWDFEPWHIVSATLIFGIKKLSWFTKQRENLNNTTIHFTSRQMWPVMKTYPVWKYTCLFFFSFSNFWKIKQFPPYWKSLRRVPSQYHEVYVESLWSVVSLKRSK